MSTDVAMTLDTVPAVGETEVSSMETDSGGEGTAVAVAPVKSRSRGSNARSRGTNATEGTNKKTAASTTNRKTKTPKAGKASTTESVHPKYNEMIAAAIAALQDRHGSSRQAILKYILANYTVQTDERKVNNHLKMSLRACVKNGKLHQPKGSGACGSYKLASPSKTKAAKPDKTSSPTSTGMTKVKVPKVASTKISRKNTPKKSSNKSVSPKKTTRSPKNAVEIQTTISPAKTKTVAKASSKKATKKNNKSNKSPKMAKTTPKKTETSEEPQAVDVEPEVDTHPVSETETLVAPVQENEKGSPSVEIPVTNKMTDSAAVPEEAAKTTKSRRRGAKKTTH